MLEPFHLQEPLFINTVGHATGVLLFALFLWLFWQDQRGASERSWLPATAASLALLWNLGSLAVLAASHYGWAAADLLAALSFSVLSLLPALLLDLSLHGRLPLVRLAGYVVSAVSVVLHVAELWTDHPGLHHTALLLITLGFGLLTVVVVFHRAAGDPPLGRVRRHSNLWVAMCLILFAVSFVHFGGGQAHQAWSTEIAWHHAGIPLALVVLLQDYRFLLLDAFLRFLVNGAAAGLFTALTVWLNERFHILQRVQGDAWAQALLAVAVCAALLLFANVRQWLQSALTRRVFHRVDPETVLSRLQQVGLSAETEQAYLEQATAAIAQFFGASSVRVALMPDRSLVAEHEAPFLVSRETVTTALEGVEAVAPIRLGGETRALLLGRRQGRRRYLSEDLVLLGKLAAMLGSQLQRFRRREVEKLVSEAELRALQAQINPHFLFNALNTLYGTISRSNAEARRLVLNLADLFRYFLQTDRPFRPLADELRIIEAYLEVEALRLGDRLRTEIDADPDALAQLVPVLSIQPIVENAVKHGVAAQKGAGLVRLEVRHSEEGLRVRVSDTGPGFAATAQAAHSAGSQQGTGVGLENVRKRLQLCYGPEAALVIRSSAEGTVVEFLVPQPALAGSRA